MKCISRVSREIQPPDATTRGDMSLVSLPARSMFVTVGTTEFDQLITKINSEMFLKCLEQSRITRLVVQIGRGTLEPMYLVENCAHFGIAASFFRFKGTLNDDMQASDIIVSHCGAGSILEATAMGKPLICVVNSSLQDNHQTELSGAVDALNNPFLRATDPTNLLQAIRELVDAIKGFDSSATSLHRIYEADIFPIHNPDLFPSILSSSMFDFELN